jgi:predicted unusual protein kinase regulating ubiquinone biosynthesis (AarF/ABC1/UbiB family)
LIVFSFDQQELIEKYWSKERGALQKRWGEFLRYSVPFLTRCVSLLIRGGTAELVANDRSLAREARVIMETLGPTYIKLGQVLSVRPDILPQAALDELTILQDNVKAYPTSTAVEVIERELGGPLGSFFSSISEEPVAAASLAQVYRAVVADGLPNAGAVVAVKVQRPDILQVVSKDLYVLRRAAEVYQGLVDRFAPQQRTDWVALLNEWAVGFYTELDFTNELSNQALLKRLMTEQGVKEVYVPKGYPELSTRKVMVTEWMDGVKLSDCEPAEIRELIKVGQEAFLVQLLQVGVFHSDPHPGNLMRLDDSLHESKGKLALLDFGLVARLQQSDMDAIVSAVIHLANRDYAALVDDFVELGILPADCDRALVVPLMDKALTPYVKGGGAKRYEEELRKTYGFGGGGEGGDSGGTVGSTVGGFQAMTQDFLTVLNDIPFSIPPYFALIGRAVVTLEGVALTGDPNYGIITEAYPFVARKLLREDRPEIQKALQEVLYGGGSGGGERFNAQRLAALVNSALGSVAKSGDGASFVDLDTVPEDGASARDMASFLLAPLPQNHHSHQHKQHLANDKGSGGGGGGGGGGEADELSSRAVASSSTAASLWRVLEPELVQGADLLARQALRRTAAATFASLPRPRLPFVGVVGPAPQDVPAPLLIPAPGTAASLASRGLASSVADSFSSFRGVSATQHEQQQHDQYQQSQLPRVAFVSGSQVVDALCPPLSREEELYAISLADLVGQLVGPDAATLLRGEALSDPSAASRVLLTAFEAVESTNSLSHPTAIPAGVASAVSLLAPLLPATARSISASPPLDTSVGGSELGEARALYESLSEPERDRLGEISRQLFSGLLERFELRLQALP